MDVDPRVYKAVVVVSFLVFSYALGSRWYFVAAATFAIGMLTIKLHQSDAKTA